MKSDLKGIWILLGLAVLFAAAALAWVARAIASESRPQLQPRPRQGSVSADAGSVHDHQAVSNLGEPVDLSVYRGKVLLIVNTASRCGFTPQYAGLQTLYEKYRDRGFEVLAFPANNFMGQEPGSDAEIRDFCSLKYKTTFPLFAKISVKGEDIHPLYRFLTTRPAKDSGGASSGTTGGDIGWNFTKFLIGEDGTVLARFGSRQDPMSREITTAVEAALGPADLI